VHPVSTWKITISVPHKVREEVAVVEAKVALEDTNTDLNLQTDKNKLFILEYLKSIFLKKVI